MKIKCGNCGKSILVPDDLVAGQHVRCPYCNEKTAFDKPSRVALPEGFEVKRKARTKIDELKRKHAHEGADMAGQIVSGRDARRPSPGGVGQEVVGLKDKRFAVRRPEQAPRDREHMNAAAAAVDARVRKAERKRRMAKIKKTVGNWISIIVLLALLWAGYEVWKSARRNEMPVRLPEQVTQIISNAVDKVNEEIAK